MSEAARSYVVTVIRATGPAAGTVATKLKCATPKEAERTMKIWNAGNYRAVLNQPNSKDRG